MGIYGQKSGGILLKTLERVPPFWFLLSSGGGQGLAQPSLDREGGRTSLEIPVKFRNGSEVQLLSEFIATLRLLWLHTGVSLFNFFPLWAEKPSQLQHSPLTVAGICFPLLSRQEFLNPSCSQSWNMLSWKGPIRIVRIVFGDTPVPKCTPQGSWAVLRSPCCCSRINFPRRTSRKSLEMDAASLGQHN